MAQVLSTLVVHVLGHTGRLQRSKGSLLSTSCAKGASAGLRRALPASQLGPLDCCVSTAYRERGSSGSWPGNRCADGLFVAPSPLGLYLCYALNNAIRRVSGSEQTMATVTHEHVLQEVQQLTPEEQRRLRDHLTVLVADPATRPVLRRSSYGALAHLGPAPSAEEIDAVRREVWASFPRDDIE